MSKVKIQGNASGTGVLTLEAPNTNTDRTITLPDEDITLGGGVDGIVSSANATAITIDSNENVGIGVTPSQKLHVKGRLLVERDANANETLSIYQSGGYHYLNVQEGTSTAGTLIFTKGTSSDETFRITSDGRGLSEFTAKAWVNFDGTSNVGGNCSIRDSHNVSTVTDNGSGKYTVNFSNDMANTDYCVSGSAGTTNTGAGQRLFTTGHAISYAGWGPSFSVGSFRIAIIYADLAYTYDATHISAVVYGD
jgi:hypothetical protein